MYISIVVVDSVRQFHSFEDKPIYIYIYICTHKHINILVLYVRLKFYEHIDKFNDRGSQTNSKTRRESTYKFTKVTLIPQCADATVHTTIKLLHTHNSKYTDVLCRIGLYCSKWYQWTSNHGRGIHPSKQIQHSPATTNSTRFITQLLRDKKTESIVTTY